MHSRKQKTKVFKKRTQTISSSKGKYHRTQIISLYQNNVQIYLFKKRSYNPT